MGTPINNEIENYFFTFSLNAKPDVMCQQPVKNKSGRLKLNEPDSKKIQYEIITNRISISIHPD